MLSYIRIVQSYRRFNVLVVCLGSTASILCEKWQSGSKNRGKSFNKKFKTIYYYSVVADVSHHMRSMSFSAESRTQQKSFQKGLYKYAHIFVLCRFVVNVRHTYFGFYTKHIVIRAYVHTHGIVIYTYCIYIWVVCRVYTQIHVTHSKFIRENLLFTDTL